MNGCTYEGTSYFYLSIFFVEGMTESENFQLQKQKQKQIRGV